MSHFSCTFVIVTYRPNKITLRNLQSALWGWPVILVDNSKKNRGYGGGANVGIRKALERGAEWVAVMNQDLQVTKEAIDQFVKILKDSQPGIVGPFAGSLNPRRWTTIVPSKRADYISGSCIGIHREVIEKVGYFYEPYFLYYEEVDLCLRAKKQGFLLRWLPIKEISHEESVSLGKGSFLHQYYLSRNHLLFVERQAPFRVKLYEFLRLPKTIYEHYVRKEWGALAGIIDYFLRRFGPYRGNL